MPIDRPLAATLAQVALAMAGARDPWWVIGSAAVALHLQAEIAVADVDVLLSSADARHILPALGVEPRAGTQSALFRSELFGLWHGAPLPAEFMADFALREDGAWHRVWPASRLAWPVGAPDAEGGPAVVYTPDRAELGQILTRFGRPKDMARLRLLGADQPHP